MSSMSDEKTKLEQVIRLGNLVSRARDIDFLMERILSEAREIVNADAGSIYKCDGDFLVLKYTQNDTMQKRLPPGKKLLYATLSVPINSNSIAGHVARTGEMLNIADVYALPGNLPYAFDKEYDERSGYKTRSMLTMPLKTSRDVVVGVLQMINALDENGVVIGFSQDDIRLINHFGNNAAGALEKADMTRTIILRMIRMAELRDPTETGPHVNRVAAISQQLYETWALKNDVPDSEIEEKKDTLRIAAMLHDVGKVAISDVILKKAGKLTGDEFRIMKQHCLIGARLFADAKSDFDEMSAEVALTHHERWDGKGYPGHIDVNTGLPLKGYEGKDGNARGKKGPEIPIWGRIVSIADVYDALSHKRVYKDAWPEEDVIGELKKQAGSQFDAEFIDIFLSISDMIRYVSEEYPDKNITTL